jgi:hypothetical protein
MTEAIAITVGMTVEGDEHFLGEVEQIELDPSGRFVVQVRIRPSHEGGAPRLVPAQMLEHGSRGLRLHCSLEEFEQLPPAEGARP